MKPILFIFSGLPATGKSTLSKLIAKKYNAVYLRIDTVEQALRDLCHFDVQGEGYRLSYRIASDNLNLQHNVVSDSCNPIDLACQEWENVAKNSESLFTNIEIICSDKEEHKRQIETRISDVKGLKLPTWEYIESCEYHLWDSKRMIIDTANKSVDESFIEFQKSRTKVLIQKIRGAEYSVLLKFW